jgi:hypothetical protein
MRNILQRAPRSRCFLASTPRRHPMTMMHALIVPAFALVLGASLLSGSTASLAQPVPATEAKQWTIDRTEAVANTPYRFTNLYNNSALAYRATDPGLHLYWSPISGIVYGGTWQLRNENFRDHRTRPIASGQKVSIFSPYPKYKTPRGERTGSYLVYSSGSSTSQLKWQTAPDNAAEWIVAIDPATKHASLYNTRKADFLVFDRANKVGWLSKQAGQGTVHDASVTMSAQPVTQGFLPFLGYFGGGVNFNAVLTEVRSASGNGHLSFVKPGHSTQECGNASAVIGLAPGAALTAAQMTTLYGSATPSLQNRIAFLACAATNASAVFLNIKYRDL